MDAVSRSGPLLALSTSDQQVAAGEPRPSRKLHGNNDRAGG